MNRMSVDEYRRIADDGAVALRNRCSNDRGKLFEDLLVRGCRFYEIHRQAKIGKVYEPYVCTRILKGGRFEGRFIGRAEPDFKGVLRGGQAIAFEAKSTQKSRIQGNVLTNEQIDWLTGQQELGALAFVAVNIQDKFFSLPLDVWINMKKLYGKKYLMPADIEEYEVVYDGAVRFLEFVHGGLLNKQMKGSKDDVSENN